MTFSYFERNLYPFAASNWECRTIQTDGKYQSNSWIFTVLMILWCLLSENMYKNGNSMILEKEKRTGVEVCETCTIVLACQPGCLVTCESEFLYLYKKGINITSI